MKYGSVSYKAHKSLLLELLLFNNYSILKRAIRRHCDFY